MFNPSRNRALLVAALVGSIGLSACNDALTGPEAASDGQAASKLRHAHLMDRAAVESAGKAPSQREVQLIVGFDVVSSYKVLRRYKVVRRYKYALDGAVLSVRQDSLKLAVEDISNDPEVGFVEPDVTFESTVDGSGKSVSRQAIPWGVDYVGATVSSTRAGDGTGSVDADVFILDSGVNHTDLNVVERLDFTGQGLDDKDGHGTHVAGTVAAIDDREDVVGVAPGARIHSYRVLGNNGGGKLSNVLDGVERVAKYRKSYPTTPIVANLSFGYETGTTQYNSLDEAVRNSVQMGIVFVVAAGNAGQDAATISPAHVVEAITVGAHHPHGRFAPFSNHGSVVDILAPGVDILSTGVRFRDQVMSGTSMAAPHVTGAVALYLSKNPAATPAQVYEALMNQSRTTVTNVPAGTTNRSLYVGSF